MKRPAALDEIGEESVRAIAEDRARHLQAELEARCVRANAEIRPASRKSICMRRIAAALCRLALLNYPPTPLDCPTVSWWATSS